MMTPNNAPTRRTWWQRTCAATMMAFLVPAAGLAAEEGPDQPEVTPVENPGVEDNRAEALLDDWSSAMDVVQDAKKAAGEYILTKVFVPLKRFKFLRHSSISVVRWTTIRPMKPIGLSWLAQHHRW